MIPSPARTGRADLRQSTGDQVEVPSRLTEEKHYGMHRHVTVASSVVVFGGGAKRGFVHGETADERPFTSIKHPVTITDLHATFYTMIGVRPDCRTRSRSGRSS